MTTLATNLRRMIAERGTTAYRVTKDSGVSFATVYALLRGEGNPTLLLMSKLADALGCSVYDLLAPVSDTAQGDTAKVASVRATSPVHSQPCDSKPDASGDQTSATSDCNRN